MFNTMPINIAIIPQFIFNFIIFNNQISVVRLQTIFTKTPLVFAHYDRMQCSYFNLLCTGENLIITSQKFYKDCFKFFPIMLALCSMLSETYYAQKLCWNNRPGPIHDVQLYGVEVYNVYVVTVKQLAIQLNFEQNIEILSKIVNTIGQNKKNCQKEKQVKIKAKQTDPQFLVTCSRLQLQYVTKGR